MISMIGSRLTDEILYRSRPLRVLIFNCTSGRSGTSFLGAMFERLALQLRLHKRSEPPQQFFDHVIFCANVTYASGNFKGGLYLYVPLRSTFSRFHPQTSLQNPSLMLSSPNSRPNMSSQTHGAVSSPPSQKRTSTFYHQ